MRTFAIAIATLVALSSVANAANCGCPAPVKTAASATIKVGSSGGVPRLEACRADGKYYRAQNDLFKKYKMMIVCDASQGIGAGNLKGDDGNVGKTSRPGSGPEYVDGCVVTIPGDVGKRAYNQAGTALNGCRVPLQGVREVDSKLVYTINGADYVKGFFGMKKF